MYQPVQYVILPDGSHAILQSATFPQPSAMIIEFGMAMIFMGFALGMMRNLITDSLQAEKETPRLLPANIDKTGHRELFEKLEAMTPNQRERWARGNGWGSTADDAYRALFSSMLRIPLKRGETWRGRAMTYIQKYYSNTTIIYSSNQPEAQTEEGESKISESWLSGLSKTGVAMVIPSDWCWLLTDNRRLIELDLLPTTEATESRVEGILKQLKAGVESIQQSDQFRLFLSTMAKFHDYSIGNMILIMLQKPNATHVAGFSTWKELGRWVKSGEKGIAILAPVFPPAATCEKCGVRLPRNAKFCPKCGAETDQGEVIAATPRYFRIVHVFDLSQTEGKPLPEYEVPALTGEANEALFSQVLDLAREQGLTISFESKPEQDPEIKGFYSGKLIWVRPEESRAQQLKTLLHEMAHYYTEGVLGISRKDAETIAESAAFAIGAHFGFDTGVRSFPYVALWSQDKKVLEENLAAIRKVTGKMIEGLEQLYLKAGGAL